VIPEKLDRRAANVISDIVASTPHEFTGLI
jgi:hypothetical protein